MCRVLKISESGYYRWLKNRAKPTARQLLSVEMQAILDEHPDNDNYGVKRMNTALEQRGIRVSLRTVYRAMSETGLLHRRRSPARYDQSYNRDSGPRKPDQTGF